MRNKQQASLSLQQAGLAYLAVLFLVAAIAVSMAVISQNIDMQLKREKEQDWLFIGKQYQRAITSYYQQSPNGIKVLPASVDDLLLDKRFVAPVHHLRKAYLDPLTNQSWMALVNEENQLLGVASTLQQPILSTKIVQEFQANQADIIAQYSDVKFEFKTRPKAAQSADQELMPDIGDQNTTESVTTENAATESSANDDDNHVNTFAQ